MITTYQFLILSKEIFTMVIEAKSYLEAKKVAEEIRDREYPESDLVAVYDYSFGRKKHGRLKVVS